MIKLFDKISDKEKNKLINYLEGLYYTFKKNDNISKILKDHIIGIIIKGNAKIIHTDYNGDKLIIEELYEDDIFGSNLSYLYNKEYDMIANEETTVLVFDYDLVINTNLNQEYFNIFLKNIMIILNDKIRTLISNNASVLEIKEAAVEEGYLPLVIDGLNKVLNGITNLDELNNKLALY